MTKTKKQLLSEALFLLHTLEDKTGYENVKLGTAINDLQELLPIIDNLPVEEQTIQVGVYYYIDDEGNRVYDEEEMQREFESKIKELPK